MSYPKLDESSTPPQSARLGPDSGQYMMAYAEPVFIVGLSAIVVLSNVQFCGVVVLFVLFSFWWCRRCVTCSDLVLTDTGLRVRTPLKEFEADWSSIEKITHHMFFRLYSFDGTVYKLPVYGDTVVSRLLARVFGWFKNRQLLEVKLLQYHAAQNVTSPHARVRPFRTTWTLPSRRFVVTTLLVAASGQLAAVLLAHT